MTLNYFLWPWLSKSSSTKSWFHFLHLKLMMKVNVYWLRFGFKTFSSRDIFQYITNTNFCIRSCGIINVYMYLMDLQCVQISKQDSLFIPINISKVYSIFAEHRRMPKICTLWNWWQTKWSISKFCQSHRNNTYHSYKEKIISI